MKLRKETRIINTCTVDAIVTVYHFPVPDVAPDTPANDREVSYDFWQLYYVQKGTYACQLDGRLLTLHPGQLLLCEPGKVRRTLLQRAAQVGIVSFRCTSNLMERIKNTAITLSAEMKQNLMGILKTGTDIFTTVSDPGKFVGQELRDGATGPQLQTIKNRLELLLIDLHERAEQKREPSLSQNQKNYYENQFVVIEKFLWENLHGNITVTRICEHTGLSDNTIKRICRYAVGSGVIHYFLTLKIQEAKRLICQTDLNLTQISERLGFSGVHYFSRLFKRLTGLSPRQYARVSQDRQQYSWDP